ncbi:MAG: homocysteine S-methyltransferase family protein, partial [Bacteroidota bacterium]|nr:homocysteine S-methyltransferase family protein [Bacteroidota bacterium]
IMGRLLKKISEGKLLVSDGAWGTFLQLMGCKSGECPELWNVDHFKEVSDIARHYIKAGSDMVETNSFGANRYKLEYFGLEDRVYELNKAAAEASRAAAGDEILVLGSMGPTGKFLITEEVTEDELYQAFETQAHGLRNGGADAIIVETMTDLDEAAIAVRAAKSTGLDVVCTMTFDAMPDGSYRSMMGVAPSEMVEPLLDAGADVLGSNCGNGSLGMIDIVRAIRTENASVPILIHANAGLPVFENGETRFPETPEFMASHVQAMVEAGASIIGGCCGTGPDHIKAIRETLVQELFQ